MYRTVLGRSPTSDEVELAIKFVTTEDAQPKEEPPKPTQWQYGYGEFDEATQRLKNFYPLPHFTGSIWRGGEKEPDPKLGWVMLTASGGHAGNTQQHAAVRRWIAPRDCTVSVSGTLAHTAEKGDGVRGRLITSTDGLLATWTVARKSADTRVGPITLKQSDTIDFVVDCGRANNVDFDLFEWQVTIKKEPTPAQAVTAAAGDDNGSSWDSAAEFSGPAPKPPTPLSAWEKFAQVLLESNEFAFVD
jgi:hypothetical protein